jgi:hypothetical protein
MHLIINWSCYDDIELVRNEDGTAMLFENKRQTTKYAEGELNFDWIVVNLRDWTNNKYRRGTKY